MGARNRRYWPVVNEKWIKDIFIMSLEQSDVILLYELRDTYNERGKRRLHRTYS
jgi:hypothetical protein